MNATQVSVITLKHRVEKKERTMCTIVQVMCIKKFQVEYDPVQIYYLVELDKKKMVDGVKSENPGTETLGASFIFINN